MNTTSQTVQTKGGRRLSVVDAGPPDGVPILVQSGTPGSGLLNPSWIEVAAAKGIRLIGYDRPGYGGSTPHPGRSVADAAEDVAAIANALGIERLAVYGISGGGPHALACAALRPDLVGAVASLASLAPYGVDGLDWFAGMGDANLAEFAAAIMGRADLAQVVETDAEGMLVIGPDVLVTALRSILCPADIAVLSEDRAASMLARIRAGIGERRDGWIDDDLAFVAPWGFAVEQIRTPTLLLHGAQDRSVPFAHGEWLARHIPTVETWLTAEDGHLTLVFERAPDVFSWLLERLQ